MIPDEIELVIRAKKGDKEAFCELFRIGRERVFDYLCRFLKNRHDAEDVIIEAFTVAYKQIEKYDQSKGDFMGWLFTICRNRAKNAIRDKKKYSQTLSLDSHGEFEDGLTLDKSIPSNAERPDHTAREKEMEQVLLKIIAGLPEIYKEVVTLCDIECMPHTEAAALLGINRITLITRHNRATDKIAEELRKHGFDLRGLYGQK